MFTDLNELFTSRRRVQTDISASVFHASKNLQACSISQFMVCESFLIAVWPKVLEFDAREVGLYRES